LLSRAKGGTLGIVAVVAELVIRNNDEPATANARPQAGWCKLGRVARRFPRDLVLHVLTEEANAGRVELADGRARIVVEAFAPEARNILRTNARVGPSPSANSGTTGQPTRYGFARLRPPTSTT
jgi:hypothetical protein